MTRRTAYTVLFSVIAIYGAFVLRGPQGIPALFEKHRQIRQLEEQNATTALENQRRRERIQRLQTSTAEQEMEIRKQLKLLRPGETTFILPEGAKEKPSDGAAKP